MKTDIKDAAIFKGRKHFDLLDGLRGVAAIAIVVFHFTEYIFTDYSKNFIGHGFLAVDFFFCLSGFVIGYAYDGRIEKIGVKQFFISRLIRLHPLVIVGSVLGMIFFFADPFDNTSGNYSSMQLVLIFLSSIILIPYPVMPERGYGLFGLNTPSWSLFFEYIANVVYAMVLYRAGKRLLWILAMISAAWLVFSSYQAGTLIGGWDGKSFWDGAARVSYSFIAGLLVFRMGWKISAKIGFTGCAILLLLSFVFPYVDPNWLWEALVVMLFYPLLIAIGSGIVPGDRTRKLCTWLGNISYPLYMTHIPALWLFGTYNSTHKPGAIELAYIIIFGTILLIGFAWLWMKWFDIPVRSWLTQKRKARG